MTIGIAVAGEGAGLAAFRSLAAVEKVARGAIGGFVSFAVITATGDLVRAETQRGGTRTLFTDGETTGVLPPAAIAAAPLAVLMSSGPDRPVPLAQFTPGDPRVGLVTGHRLPNMPTLEGVVPNLALLERLRQGEAAAPATRAVLEACPSADAGLIGLDRSGRIGLGNTALVAARGDVGSTLIRSETASVAVLHNAIHPVSGLAELAAAIALDSMAPADRSDLEIRFVGPTPLVAGARNAARIDQAGMIRAIEVTAVEWLGERFEGAALNFNAAIVGEDGAVLGHAVSEPYCVARAGSVVSMSGQATIGIKVRAVRRHDPA